MTNLTQSDLTAVRAWLDMAERDLDAGDQAQAEHAGINALDELGRALGLYGCGDRAAHARAQASGRVEVMA